MAVTIAMDPKIPMDIVLGIIVSHETNNSVKLRTVSRRLLCNKIARDVRSPAASNQSATKIRTSQKAGLFYVPKALPTQKEGLQSMGKSYTIETVSDKTPEKIKP